MVNGVQEHAHVAQDERAELAPLRRFGREPRIDVLLRFRDRPLSLDDQADHAQALFLVRQAQKRAGMALGQVMLTQRLQNGRRMAQDAQLVCDGGLALADAAGSLLLAQMVLLHELLQALGLLDVIQIAPLQIFHQRQHPGRLLVHVRKQARDLRQSGQPRCAQAALSRHQLVRTARLADGQRLQNAVLPDAPGQLLQAAGIKMLARLHGIGPDPRCRQIQDPARPQYRRTSRLWHSFSPLQGLLTPL